MHATEQLKNQVSSAVARILLKRSPAHLSPTGFGEFSYHLAAQQRLISILLVSGAGILLAFPFVVDFILRDLSTLLKHSVKLPAWSYGGFLVFALVAGVGAALLWLRADETEQQALAEENVGKALHSLRLEGWHIRSGVPNAQTGHDMVLLHSPYQVAFALYIYPEKGHVTLFGKHLVQRLASRQQFFKFDLLEAAQQRAITLQRHSGDRLMIPVLVFAGAIVELPRNPINGVYVLDLNNLVSCLRLLT